MGLDAKVFGVSTDAVEKQKAFHTAQKLTFPLLSDPGGTMAKAYGIYMDRGFAKRVTFVIDPKGIVRHTFTKVSVSTHGADLAEVLKRLRAEASGATNALAESLPFARHGKPILAIDEWVVVDMVSPDRGKAAGLDEKRLPVAVNGRQVADVSMLYALLLALAEPAKDPGNPPAPMARKSLLIRANADVDYRSVLALVKLIIDVSKKKPIDETHGRSLLYRVHFGVEGGRALPLWLPATITPSSPDFAGETMTLRVRMVDGVLNVVTPDGTTLVHAPSATKGSHGFDALAAMLSAAKQRLPGFDVRVLVEGSVPQGEVMRVLDELVGLEISLQRLTADPDVDPFRVLTRE